MDWGVSGGYALFSLTVCLRTLLSTALLSTITRFLGEWLWRRLIGALTMCLQIPGFKFHH